MSESIGKIRIRPMYAGANMGHPSREQGLVLCSNSRAGLHLDGEAATAYRFPVARRYPSWSVAAESDDWVHARGRSGWNKGGNDGYQDERECCQAKRKWIVWPDAIQQAGK